MTPATQVSLVWDCERVKKFRLFLFALVCIKKYSCFLTVYFPQYIILTEILLPAYNVSNIIQQYSSEIDRDNVIKVK